MTATVDYNTKLVGELIRSCYKTQEGFRSAAKTVKDDSLKRLFELYAQQRTRFAAELREHLPFDVWSEEQELLGEHEGLFKGANRLDSIRECLAMDARTLALYKKALAERALPTRAHFVISSQLALMQRVHDRMQMMLQERPTPGPMLMTQRISA